MVASYSLEKFASEINLEIFKYPVEYISYLEKEIPRIACFSNYIWNLNLSYEIARTIKGRSPGAVVVFGGPNYPLDQKEQEAFLSAHPAMPYPDLPLSDLPLSDLPSPDLPLSDLPSPAMPLSDLPLPDLPLSDRTFRNDSLHGVALGLFHRRHNLPMVHRVEGQQVCRGW
jgi:hypothetical protein